MTEQTTAAISSNDERISDALHVQDDRMDRVLPVPSRQEEVGTAASVRDYTLGDPETAEAFVKNTWRYVRWGDGEVEAGRMSEQEQSRRIRAALADATAWIEREAKHV